MSKKEEIATNPDAQRIMGIRGAGIHGNILFDAWEQGFECPICHTKVAFNKKGDLTEESNLIQFSEYYGFVYCPKCNLDIPSYLCLTPGMVDTREKVVQRTKWFLELVEDCQLRVKHLKRHTTLTNLQLQEQVNDLLREVHYLKNFNMMWMGSRMIEVILKDVKKQERAEKKAMKNNPLNRKGLI